MSIIVGASRRAPITTQDEEAVRIPPLAILVRFALNLAWFKAMDDIEEIVSSEFEDEVIFCFSRTRLCLLACPLQKNAIAYLPLIDQIRSRTLLADMTQINITQTTSRS